jgi:hypothetical protein
VQRHDVELPIHLEYVVCHDAGEWTVTLMERLIASYRCEADALRGAIEAARDAGIRGHRAEVLIRERGNFLRQAWAFGRNPFPPPEPQD